MTPEVKSGIERLPTVFADRYGATIIVGAEIEWYLRPRGIDVPWDGAKFSQTQEYFSTLCDACDSLGIDLQSLDEEDGPAQVEAALPAREDTLSLITDLENIQTVAVQVAEAMDLQADFAAKPYAAQFGSGLHIHVHLADEQGNNLYSKREDDMSDALSDSIAGLLARMDQDMVVFAPTEDSWKRFEAKFHAPVNASWGGNNRTVALRLPDSMGDRQGVEDIAAMPYTRGRRIEHRVAGADADPGAVMLAILNAIAFGLHKHPDLAEPIYGDAAHAQYGLDGFNRS